jgi:hypothetical protein
MYYIFHKKSLIKRKTKKEKTLTVAGLPPRKSGVVAPPPEHLKVAQATHWFSIFFFVLFFFFQ